MNRFLYFVQEREVAPSGLALLLVWMSFGGHIGQPVPITTHWPVGQVVPYQWMHDYWHGLAKNAAKTSLSWWDCCAMVRVSAVFCGCGVAIIWYTSCTVRCPNNTPTMWKFSLIHCNDKMVPHAWWAQQNNLLTAEVIPQGWTVGERWKQVSILGGII